MFDPPQLQGAFELRRKVSFPLVVLSAVNHPAFITKGNGAQSAARPFIPDPSSLLVNRFIFTANDMLLHCDLAIVGQPKPAIMPIAETVGGPQEEAVGSATPRGPKCNVTEHSRIRLVKILDSCPECRMRHWVSARRNLSWGRIPQSLSSLNPAIIEPKVVVRVLPRQFIPRGASVRGVCSQIHDIAWSAGIIFVLLEPVQFIFQAPWKTDTGHYQQKLGKEIVEVDLRTTLCVSSYTRRVPWEWGGDMTQRNSSLELGQIRALTRSPEPQFHPYSKRSSHHARSSAYLVRRL